MRYRYSSLMEEIGRIRIWEFEHYTSEEWVNSIKNSCEISGIAGTYRRIIEDTGGIYIEHRSLKNDEFMGSRRIEYEEDRRAEVIL